MCDGKFYKHTCRHVRDPTLNPANIIFFRLLTLSFLSPPRLSSLCTSVYTSSGYRAFFYVPYINQTRITLDMRVYIDVRNSIINGYTVETRRASLTLPF